MKGLLEVLVLAVSMLWMPLPSSAGSVYDPQNETVSISQLQIPGIDGRQRVELVRIEGGWPWMFQVASMKPAPTPAVSGLDAYYDPVTRTLVIPRIAVRGREEQYYARFQLLPGDAPYRLILTRLQDWYGNGAAPMIDLDSHDGAPYLTDALTDQLAAVGSGGNVGFREIKFVILGIDTPNPLLLFQNSRRYPYHFDFVYEALGLYHNGDRAGSEKDFLKDTYFSRQRRNLGGALVFYPDAGAGPQVALEFWPTDPVTPAMIRLAYDLVRKALPPARHRLVWRPASETHRGILAAHRREIEASGIPVIGDMGLYGGLTEVVLNPGETYGILKRFQPGDAPPGPMDIALFTFPPNDLNQFAGLITETPQTYLSHVNLRAHQSGRPNAYIADAGDRHEIAWLLDQWVHFQAGSEGILLEPASQSEAEAWFEQLRPVEPPDIKVDLTRTEPVNLREIGFNDWTAFGVKAANVAELGKILPDGMVPKGYAIPFAFYDRFMSLPRCGPKMRLLCGPGETGPSLYDQARNMLADEQFRSDPAIRRQRLKALRKQIKKSESPADLTEALENIRYFWNPDGPPFTQSLRLRSSTNNEDLPQFNGAGLYSSTTHRPDEGDLVESAKKVWASLWNARAYETREFYRIDHFSIYMGILVHPNYGDEQANGVAVSTNVYLPQWPGYTINAQYGEILITNPKPVTGDSGIVYPVPDALVVARLPISRSTDDWETIFIRHSNVTQVYGNDVPTETVLLPDEVDTLRKMLTVIHHHFKRRYLGDGDFAIEIEFKITQTGDGSRGRLSIKQARPWVYGVVQ